MFYSSSTGGFYDARIHGAAIPGDAVPISPEHHAELLAGQSAGKRISHDAAGNPVLADPAPTPLPVIIEAAKARVRAARVAVFATLAGIQSQALADGDTANAQAISTIQTQLADLPGIDLSACETAKDVEEAFALAWATIAATAPAKVAKAFNQVLAP